MWLQQERNEAWVVLHGESNSSINCLSFYDLGLSWWVKYAILRPISSWKRQQKSKVTVHTEHKKINPHKFSFSRKWCMMDSGQPSHDCTAWCVKVVQHPPLDWDKGWRVMVMHLHQGCFERCAKMGDIPFKAALDDALRVLCTLLKSRFPE